MHPIKRIVAGKDIRLNKLRQSAGYHAPRLNLPGSLDVGPVHAGAARGKQIYVRNLGGPGFFRWDSTPPIQPQNSEPHSRSTSPSRIPVMHGIGSKQKPCQVTFDSCTTDHAQVLPADDCGLDCIFCSCLATVRLSLRFAFTLRLACRIFCLYSVIKSKPPRTSSKSAGQSRCTA